MKLQIILFISFACILAVSAEDKAKTQGKVCEPGQVCKCNAEGTEFDCENKTSTENQKVPEKSEESDASGSCTPGEVYKVKCNECKCPPSGSKSEASCTVIACPDK